MTTIFERHMTEAELQAAVIDVFEANGWLFFHDNDSRRNNAGFPDLVAVKPPRVLFIELKKEDGRVRPEQQTWIDALDDCDVISCGVVRPSQLDSLIRTLTRPTPTP